MTTRLRTTLGYYTPAFFHIHVGTNLSFTSFSDKDFSVFLHEYIHFIQDVTTLYGINNMYVYSEYIRYAINEAYKSPDKKIDIPITPKDSNEDNVYLNLMINRLTCGDGCDISIIKQIKQIDIIVEDIDVPKSSLKNIESTVLTIVDNDDKEQLVSFGAIAIMESMAYLMERLLCPSYIKSPDFPYCIAEKIIEKEYPDFAKDSLNVLALCDVSLLYSNPGKIFIQFIREMKDDNWMPKNPEDIYDNIYSRVNIVNNTTKISLEDNLKGFLEIVKIQIQGYFNDPKLFSEINNWINHITITAYNLRFKDKYFILDVARGGMVRDNKVLKTLIDKTLGTPLISNVSGECTLKSPVIMKGYGVDISYFAAVGQIISLFESAKYKCDLHTICTYYKNNVDERCIRTPWKHITDVRYCPFALLWYHWKLKEYEPK